jgi:hypothetical protein
VSQRVGPRAPCEREGCAGRERVEHDDHAACHPDLFAEGPEQQGQQLERERPREDEHVAVQAFALRQALRDVQLDAFFEQVRLEAAHQCAAHATDQHPEQHREPTHDGQRAAIRPVLGHWAGGSC